MLKSKLVRLLLAMTMLVGSTAVNSFADGTEPPPCIPGSPNCPKDPKALDMPQFYNIPGMGLSR